MQRTALKLITTTFAGLFSFSALADSLSIDLASDAVRIQYGSTVSMSADSEFEWDAGFLLVEGDNGESDRKLVTGTVRSIGDAGIAEHQVSAALGARAFWLNGEGFDAQAVGVGGEVSARLSGMDRIVFNGYAYYAPQILSFGDADAFLEWGGRAGYQVIRNGEVYVGYRQVKIEPTQGPDVTADTGFNLGMRFEF